MGLVQVYKAERVLKARRRRKPEWQIEKPADSDAGREAYAIAAKYENRFARAFVEATQSLLTQKIATDFQSQWRTGTVDDVMAAIPFFGTDKKPEVWDEFVNRLMKAYGAVIQAAGDEATEKMNEQFKTNMKFSLVEKQEVPVVPVNPYSIQWMRNRALWLVRQGITEQQLEVVRDIIGRGFELGERAEEAYAAIKANIGLTDREYRAVAKRQLLHQEAGLPRAEVEQLTGKYRESLLKKRAARIARTETIMAQAQGRKAAWQVAQDAGVLPPVERVWVAVPSACEICSDLDGKTAPIDGAYESIVGPIEGPTAHPHCVCSEILQRTKGR